MLRVVCPVLPISQGVSFLEGGCERIRFIFCVLGFVCSHLFLLLSLILPTGLLVTKPALFFVIVLQTRDLRRLSNRHKNLVLVRSIFFLVFLIMKLEVVKFREVWKIFLE